MVASTPSRLTLVALILASAAVPARAAGQVVAPPNDPAGFRDWAGDFAGAYEVEDGGHLIVVPHTALRLLSVYDTDTGLVRPLEPAGADTFVYGPNVVSTTPVEGRLAIERDASGDVAGLQWARPHGPITPARRVQLVREPVRFRNGDRADLRGWLITPPGDEPRPLAVILQPGANDRYGLWRLAMALAVDSIGVLVYDRRGVAESTGDALPSHYWAATQELATDAVAAVGFARSHPRVDPSRVGVVGWSQGGWMGALVANRVPDLAFYVSIAGNANPGWQQNRWNKLTTLRFEGFDEVAIGEAERFLEVYFDLMHDAATWAEYRAAVAEAGDRDWFAWGPAARFRGRVRAHTRHLLRVRRIVAARVAVDIPARSAARSQRRRHRARPAEHDARGLRNRRPTHRRGTGEHRAHRARDLRRTAPLGRPQSVAAPAPVTSIGPDGADRRVT